MLCGTRIHITGDAIVPGTTSLLVMNHRTRTDWNFLWPAVYHATSLGTTVKHNRYLHPLKFVLKDAIRHIPGPGKLFKLSADGIHTLETSFKIRYRMGDATILFCVHQKMLELG